MLVELERWLPSSGQALDVAGGAGRHAQWLARRGLQVTLVDIADVALELARGRAEAAALAIATQRLDLELDAVPAGPWDLILTFHFLHRPLIPRLLERLGPGGVIVVVQPTLKNLERHSRPPVRFLLEPGELARLLVDVELVHYREEWSAEGRHEAIAVAKRPM